MIQLGRGPSVATISLFALSGAGGMVASFPTALAASDQEVCTELRSTMTAPVGQVCVAVTDDSVKIRVSAADRFTIREIQLAVASSLDGIPRAGSGAPQIGVFPVRSEYDPGVRTTAHAVGLEAVALGADSLFVAVHASVVEPSGIEHGSWGAGPRFQDPGPPATYFTVPIPEAGCEPRCRAEGLRSHTDGAAPDRGSRSHLMPHAAFRLEG